MTREEFKQAVERDYPFIIKTLIRRFHIHPDRVEAAVHQKVAEFLEKGKYQHYDETRGAFSTWFIEICQRASVDLVRKDARDLQKPRAEYRNKGEVPPRRRRLRPSALRCIACGARVRWIRDLRREHAKCLDLVLHQDRSRNYPQVFMHWIKKRTMMRGRKRLAGKYVPPPAPGVVSIIGRKTPQHQIDDLVTDVSTSRLEQQRQQNDLGDAVSGACIGWGISNSAYRPPPSKKDRKGKSNLRYAPQPIVKVLPLSRGNTPDEYERGGGPAPPTIYDDRRMWYRRHKGQRETHLVTRGDVRRGLRGLTVADRKLLFALFIGRWQWEEVSEFFKPTVRSLKHVVNRILSELRKQKWLEAYAEEAERNNLYCLRRREWIGELRAQKEYISWQDYHASDLCTLPSATMTAEQIEFFYGIHVDNIDEEWFDELERLARQSAMCASCEPRSGHDADGQGVWT